MDEFDVKLQWDQPGKDTLLTIHRIQWQKCSGCAPLRLLISEPNMNNGQKAIFDISTTNKKFVNLYKLLRLYLSTHLTELDALVQFMRNQIIEKA